jgi:hypothetical protein
MERGAIPVLQARGKNDHEPLVFSQQFILSSIFGDCGQRFAGIICFAGSQDGVLPNVLLWIAEVVRIANADGHEGSDRRKSVEESPKMPPRICWDTCSTVKPTCEAKPGSIAHAARTTSTWAPSPYSLKPVTRRT